MEASIELLRPSSLVLLPAPGTRPTKAPSLRKSLPETTASHTENLVILQESLRRGDKTEAAINFSIMAILVTSFAAIFALFLGTIVG
jgi:hypothetical protein